MIAFEALSRFLRQARGSRMKEPRNVDLKVIAVQNQSPEATCDVVFIHGLGGDPIKTWLYDGSHPESSWPNLFAADLPSARVWALGYPADQFGGRHARAMSIEDRANAVLENLAAQGFGARRIVFIAHSLGGLVVKQMLHAAALSADSRWHQIGEAVLGVVFLATPHAGSKLANVAKAFGVLGPSVATLDLEQYSAKLLELREWFSEYSVRNAIEVAAFCETRPSSAHGLPIGIIVPKDSAWPGGTTKTIPVDNVDHFQIARPPNREATVYKDVRSILDKWLARDGDRTQVPLDLEASEPYSEGSKRESEALSRFLFRTRRVPLFGRASELNELNKFLDDKRQFTWCAVTGPGGTGKSRLALEFCLQLSPKWRAGFLKDWTSTEFRNWTPNRPTLIIVDYVSARARDVGSIVRDLQERSALLPFPVRLVLLERQDDGLWVREFLGAGGDRQKTELGQYDLFPATADARPMDPYNDVIRLRTLVVGPLSPEALWECMLSVFSSSGSHLTSRQEDPDYKAKLLAHLLEIDPSGRPLFAAFFADAISADPDMLEWDRSALVENVLRREQEKFWKPNGVTEVELDVLALATLVHGIGYDHPDVPPDVHDSKEFSPERYAIACGVDASESLHPLEPDMIGEIFVLDRFRTSSKQWKAEKMRDSGWKLGPLEMAAFLSRAARDFPHHPALWHLGSSPQNASLHERYIWLRVAAEQLLPTCADNVRGSDARNSVSWCDAFWDSYREILILTSGHKGQSSDDVLFARALNELGYTLAEHMNDGDRAVTVYNVVLERFGAADEPILHEVIASALLRKGLALTQVDRWKDAIPVFDELISRFSASPESGLREKVAAALLNRGAALGETDRSEDAIAVYDELVARFGAAAEPSLVRLVASALHNKGVTQEKRGCAEEAIVAYEDIVARFGAATEPSLREAVVVARFNMSSVLNRLDRSEEAIASYENVVRQFGAASEPELREFVARALVAKGTILVERTRSEEAITAFNEVIERFGGIPETAFRELVARALFNKGVTLAQRGCLERARVAYEEVVVRFGAAEEPELFEIVAGALINKGDTFRLRGRWEEALAVYKEVIARFDTGGESALDEEVAGAMFNKGLMLGQLNRWEEEIAAYDQLVARFGAAAEPALRELVARSLVGKGMTLGERNHSEAAIALYNDVVSRFGAATEPTLREIVEIAEQLRGSDA